MNIILFGPPGAGKGTQSQYLVNKLNNFQISTGDILRSEIKNDTVIGKQIINDMNEGKFVSDEIVNQLIEKLIHDPKKKDKFIFDGYPRSLSHDIKEGKEISIKPKKVDQNSKRLWGMNRSLINNAVIGSSTGYEKILELVGVGYRAALKGNQLNLQLGYSHDINYDIPDGIKIEVEKQTTLKISGSDKQQVGSVASKIKTYRKIEPYKGKGIREKGQYVLKKEGKKK